MPQEKPQKPKPPRKSKRLKLLISERDKWKQILKQVETPEAPLSVIQKIEVELIDGSIVDINIPELLAEGYEEGELEDMINERLEANDHIIAGADFYINADFVANTVQPITDRILRKI